MDTPFYLICVLVILVLFVAMFICGTIYEQNRSAERKRKLLESGRKKYDRLDLHFLTYGESLKSDNNE